METLINRELNFICPKCGRISKGSIMLQEGEQRSISINVDPQAVAFNSSVISTLHTEPICKDCGRQRDYNKMYFVDDPLGEIIAKFNKLGYNTQYSCAGHIDPTGKASNCYIQFDCLPSAANIELYDTAYDILESGEIENAKEIFKVSLSSFTDNGLIARYNFPRGDILMWDYSQVTYGISNSVFFELRDMAKEGKVAEAQVIQKYYTDKFVKWLKAIVNTVPEQP